MPEDLVPEQVPITDLRPHPDNYRTHPEDQLEQLQASIREHGFYRNVVVARDGTILAGHGVVEAATREGLDHVLVVRLDIDADSTQARKLLAGDNYLSHFAMDDDRALAEMLKAIKDADDNPTGLMGTGFTDMALAGLAMVTRHANEIEDFDAAAEWAGAGMPEASSGSKAVQLVVQFMSEEDRDRFVSEFGLDETKIHRRESGMSMWWPYRDRHDLTSVEVDAQGNAQQEAPA